MRHRNAPLAAALAALTLVGTSCSAREVQPPGADNHSVAEHIASGDLPADAAPPTPATAAPAVNIRAVDLGSATWQYSYGGFDAPVTLDFVNGAAADAGGGFPIQYALEDVSYGDVDGDDDEDAVARVSRTQDNGYEALWYVWLAEGAEAVQMKYPIAYTSRCGTFVESVVISDGTINTTEYLRIPGLDDSIPCSDPGTGLKKRTITVHSAGSESWPVQTAPVAAWGGLCAGPGWPDTAPGIVDLWAAPDKGAPVSATASPDAGAVFAQKGAALTERAGWALVGFRLFGVESDLGGTDMACAWAVN